MRSKLQRFKENSERSNVIEPGKAIFDHIRGKWNSLYFENDRPIVLELGCGNGEYTVQLAAQFPDKNFIGVDIKGTRIWRGSKDAMDMSLPNAAFLRTQILHIEEHVAPNEVSEIWITFPDPRPRKRDIKRRLTSPRFLNIYRNLLSEKGIVHLKTDNTPLFDYSLEVLEQLEVLDLVYTHNLYDTPLLKDHHGIQTRYEKMFLSEGESIKYLRFRFNPEIAILNPDL